VDAAVGVSAQAPAPDRKPAILFVLAAASALAIIVGPLLNFPCDVCSGGLVSISLPWIGLAFYSVLAIVAFRAPNAPFLALISGFYLFVHASLITEMFLMPRFCLGCLAVAVFAAGAAFCRRGRNRQDDAAAGVAIALGIAAAFLSPFDRVDDFMTRKLWPVRMLEAAPSWVSRDELARCDHPAGARLVIYEKDCKS